jgi:hypothetical protein
LGVENQVPGTGYWSPDSSIDCHRYLDLGDALYRTKDVEGAKAAWHSAVPKKDPERSKEAAGRLKSLELGKPPHIRF